MESRSCYTCKHDIRSSRRELLEPQLPEVPPEPPLPPSTIDIEGQGRREHSHGAGPRNVPHLAVMRCATVREARPEPVDSATGTHVIIFDRLLEEVNTVA